MGISKKEAEATRGRGRIRAWIPIKLAVLLATLTLTACTAVGNEEPPSSTTPDGVPGVVTWIIDGDTVQVDTADDALDVRLMGINAPDDGECFFEDGLDHLIVTLKDSDVALEVVGLDQFGRTLAHVFSNGTHVNLDLVSRGMALATTPDNDPMSSALVEAEDRAYRSGTGLWGQNACGRAVDLPALSIDDTLSQPNPAGPDEDALELEMVVIRNDGASIVDLSGWILRDESSRHRFRFRTDALIEPGTTLTVTSADIGWTPGGGAVWNNDGDMALLQDENGTVVARWRY